MTNANKGPLSLEETTALLGAEPPERIEPVSLDPIGAQWLAAQIGARLSKAAREEIPSSSWEIAHDVPMRKDTWKALQDLASELERRDGKHVEVEQLAALAIELGLPRLRAGGRTLP